MSFNKVKNFIKKKLKLKKYETITSTNDESSSKKTIEEQQRINEMFPKKKTGKFGLFIGSVLGFIFVCFILYWAFSLITYLFSFLF